MNSSKKFLSKVMIDLINHNVEIQLIQDERLRVVENGNEIFLKGFFKTDKKLQFAIAMKNKFWLTTLIHEYCHFKQLIEKDPCFYKNSKEVDLFYNWIEDHTIEIDEETIEIGVNSIFEIELNCEKRAVEMILKEKLPINILEYIQKANAYFMFHSFMKKYRTWGNSISTDEVPEIWQSMPTTFFSKLPKLNKSSEKKMLKFCYSDL